MFDAISTAGTGLQTYHTWLDSIANNIANVNDVAPTSGQAFQQQYVQTTEIKGANGIGAGVAVTSLSSEHRPRHRGAGSDQSAGRRATATCCGPTSTCPSRWAT